MVGRRGCIEVFLVATYALRGETKPVELTNGSDFVAGVTIDDSVSTNERKPILVLVDVMNGNLPTIGVMAEFAFRSVLPAMKVGVAVLALIRGTCEFEVVVAITAGNGCVPSSERKTCLRVIKPDPTGKSLPVLGGVTCFAGNLEFSMRAASRCDGLW